MCNAETIHKFEAAGCGVAPFRVLGVEVRVGPLKFVDKKSGLDVTVGSPGQPMGCCDYCGQGIAECWIIVDAKGHRFMVGSTCVNKTGDAGLRRGMAPHKRKLAHARDDARIAAARELGNRDDVRGALEALPHPNPYRAEQGDTLADWCGWMLSNAGRSGMIKVARVIEKAAKGLTS